MFVESADIAIYRLTWNVTELDCQLGIAVKSVNVCSISSFESVKCNHIRNIVGFGK